MKLITSKSIESVMSDYPELAQGKLMKLRSLILNVAQETPGVELLEETLKWGEPSYLTKYGSTIRIDWKKKQPDQYAIYFKCTSQLVPTFRAIYKNIFNYETNRAIVFKLDEQIPEKELKHCIALALTYHKVKHLPLLGVG